MNGSSFALYLVAFLLVYADVMFTKMDFYITPSQSSACPKRSCLTLSQFAANSEDYHDSNETDINLFLLPGSHILDRVLFVANKGSFMMMKQTKVRENVLIECGSLSGKFEIKETKFALIHGVQFTQCANNKVMWVDQLILNNTIFVSTDYSNITAGALYIFFSNVVIVRSKFVNNSADYGGAINTTNSSLRIERSFFSYNRAKYCGGVMATSGSLINITNTSFIKNEAGLDGGVLDSFNDSYTVTQVTFSSNDAFKDGGVMWTDESTVSISNCSINDNMAASHGGTISSVNSEFRIKTSTFGDNKANNTGGVMWADTSSVDISASKFVNNFAYYSGVLDIVSSSFIINNSIFTDNNASQDAGVMWCSQGSVTVDNSTFHYNRAGSYGGVMLVSSCSVDAYNSVFDNNFGSLYSFFSTLTFSGHTIIQNSVEACNYTKEETTNVSFPEGGAVTSFKSTVIFKGVSNLLNNQARSGGAILATESKIVVYGETTIANNKAIDSNGGGISLHHSILEIEGNCDISQNVAVNGGGIHMKGSYTTVFEPGGTLQISSNNAQDGGGIYLEENPKIYIQKQNPDAMEDLLILSDNHANYGGALYVKDETSSDACSLRTECFLQALSTYPGAIDSVHLKNTAFSNNTAVMQGPDLFGGLLDRCITSLLSEIYLHQNTEHKGITYMRNITDITLTSIASHPVRVCFCNSDSVQDCDYQPPSITVRKGETFTVSVVAVDQIYNCVSANIISSLASHQGGFGEGQQIQRVSASCSDIQFTVFSPHDRETITFFAEGPCGSSPASIKQLPVEFLNCTCPVGFMPDYSKTTSCDCVCDSQLSPYVSECNSTTKLLLMRSNTSVWIGYSNNTDPPGFIIQPYCPFDYCRLQSNRNVSINFLLPNGAEAQCAHNRSGILCGGCQQNFSLSLGSSRCLSCKNYWPALLVAITLAATVAGILLVTFILFLNMTVSVGLINIFIFYANIIGSNTTIFFPSSKPRFSSILVSWLNLEIGIDVCFINSLDAYTKTWLQLAFPVYIISLVVIVIKVSDCSPKFARLIGRNNPIATLATLILLSYAKVLSVTITILSYSTLLYPDGSKEIVWLPDGNVKYLRGKHLALVIIAVLIIIFGTPYTVVLFLWQWLLQAPNWKIFKWTRNPRLITFIATYHAPYNSKYRYWTGLLLLVRVLLYITASVTVSVNPQTLPLTVIILVGCVLVLKGGIGSRVHRNSIIDILDTAMYFNIFALAAFSLYDCKCDVIKHAVVAYISTTITVILLVVAIIYQVILLIKGRKKTSLETMPSLPSQTSSIQSKPEVTVSVVDLLTLDHISQNVNDNSANMDAATE